MAKVVFLLPEPTKTAYEDPALLTGVTTEVCVQTTMREANDRGCGCLLVEDCTASYFPEFKKATLEMIRAQGGIIGWTSSAQNIRKALSGLK